MTQSNLSTSELSHLHAAEGALARVKAWAVAPSDDWAGTLARVTLGAVLFPHGAQHLLGWFGGYGFSGTYAWMTGTLGIPGPAAAFGIVFEMVAPMLLLAGVATRAVAATTAVFMLVAGQTHLAHGFFMNWTGSAAGEGFEYHILAIALALTLVLRGAGPLAVDRYFAAGKRA